MDEIERDSEMKRDGEGGSIICLVYLIALALGSYYSSPMSHTHTHTQRDVKPSGAIITLIALDWA